MPVGNIEKLEADIAIEIFHKKSLLLPYYCFLISLIAIYQNILHLASDFFDMRYEFNLVNY